MGPEFLVMPLHVVCVCVCYLTGTASKTVEPIRRAVSSMDLVGKRNHVLTGAHIPPPEGKRSFVEHDDSTMNIVVVISIIIFLCHWVHTDTFCNAVDCRFELALEVQRWTRGRSECLPGAQKL